MAITISEQAILDSLHQVPEERWGEVLSFLDALKDAEPAIRTGEDLIRSGLVGSWADRKDLGSGREFAQQSRRQAEARRGVADAAGH